ncbi:M23 family metallopeptidase [Actinoplanes sp. CA-030573]|uniref:M23 family metallopeptidase n=1 Tax=Actinoplanes sp. CA-030573 TaxID=3239898 RepID=UPI003D901D26
MFLSATMGAALITGVAGGTAAAATTKRTAALPAEASFGATTSDMTDKSGGRSGLPGELLPGNVRDNASRQLTGTDDDWAPTGGVQVRAGRTANGVRKKERPKAKPPTAAAWVNPNPSARVTSCFGPRWGHVHEGVDLAAPDGTPIVAAGAGVVVRAGVAEGYGNAVLIDHGDGFLTHYGHLAVITVVVGQHVAAGQQIGNEGSTGHSTGPHLHFEVHQGFYQNPIEPTRWMHEHGVDIPGCAVG